MSRNWYAYDSIGSPFDPASYRKQSSTPGCLHGPTVCAIYSPGDLHFPAELSSNIITYIANGLSNNIAEPAVPIGAKFYVYMKGLNL